MGGIEYSASAIEAIYHPEGRARLISSNWEYEYAVKDHLGNARVYFKYNGSISFLQESHYYPFGFEQGGWSAPSSPENKYKYNGKEYNDDFSLGLYDYGARFYDILTGRWTSVDPSSEQGGQERLTQYQYGMNNPIRYTDPDGRCPTCPPSEWEYRATENGEMGKGLVESVKGTISGIWGAIKNPMQTLKNIGNSIAHPIETVKSIGRSIQADFAENPQKASGKAIGNAIQMVAGIGLTSQAKAASKLSEVTNPVPSSLARVVPTADVSGTLGRAGASDVFVTAADDIKGLNAAQVADKLTIPQSSSGFTIFEFPTPTSGLASPINRSTPGFVGFGRTAGGAREYTLPNQPIPTNALKRVVEP